MHVDVEECHWAAWCWYDALLLGFVWVLMLCVSHNVVAALGNDWLGSLIVRLAVWELLMDQL